MGPLIRSRRNVIFQDLSCWCWEKVAVDGWAGIPADGGGVVRTWPYMTCRYMCIAEGKEAKAQFSSVQSLSRIRLFATSWSTAGQASLSITTSRSPPKLMSIESVMPSNHFILCRPLLLLPSIFPSIRIFSNKSVLHIRWPKYWSFNFSISPSNEYSGLIFFRIDWLDLLVVQGTLKSLLQHHSLKASILLPKGRR